MPAPSALLVAAAVFLGCLAAGLATATAGTSGPDRIFANDRDNTIHGGRSADTINGGGGNDTINGGTGHDRLFGGPGNDKLDGDTGDEFLSGGPGEDLAIGGFGRDEVRGGPGDDQLYANEAGDRLYGEEGNDKLYGGTGTDLLVGGAGDDDLSGDSGKDRLVGGPGDDVLHSNDRGAEGVADCGPGKDVLYIDPYESKGGISDSHIDERGCEEVIELAAPPRDPDEGVTRFGGPGRRLLQARRRTTSCSERRVTTRSTATEGTT